jgi:AraC-like DNA-binding protein
LDQAGLQHLRLETQQATLAKIAPGTVVVPAQFNALAINYRGTLLVRSATNPRLIVVPPRSITFLKGRLKLGVVAARGEHSTQILSWASAVTPLLEHWINSRLQARSAQHSVRQVACKPIDPHLAGAIERLENSKNSGESVELLMLSAIYEIVSKLMMGADEVQLATIPDELPETLKNLTAKVRTTPSLGWPLKEAADMAGYSPFHFSRVFKQMVGYGFHEYVDRCRTECAIDMLVTTDSPVDIVASTCGFGTTQGLRESIKEYLGLVPSELRSMPEAFNFLSEV